MPDTPSNPLPQALEPALALVEREQLTGYIVAVREATRKRIAVEKGEIVFAASTDPKDRIGQALLRAGLITESDLVEGLRSLTPGAGPRLAAALTAMRKVTPEQCATVFESSIRECLLDIFLWPSGVLQITRGSLGQSDVPFPLRVAIGPLLAEGRRRRQRWQVVEGVLPDPRLTFQRNGEWPPGFPGTAGDKALVSLLESGRTLGEILLELHGQEYPIKVRLANLVERKILSTRRGTTRPTPTQPSARPPGVVPGGGVSEVPRGEFTNIDRPPAAGPPPAAPAELNHGRDELAAHEELLKEVAELTREAEAHGLTEKTMLSLAIPLNQLAERNFSAPESFLVSRFAAGPTTVGALKAICPFPAHELLGHLRKLMDQGVIRQRR